MKMPRFVFVGRRRARALAVVALGACSGAGPADDAPPSAGDSLGGRIADSSEIAPLPVLDGVAELAPVDEAAADASFARFRAELLGAVERRDADAVLAVTAPDIRNTFGGDDGVDSFREIWRPAAADSELWPTLDRVLHHGGRFSRSDADTLFMAPWVYAAWPGEIDAFEHVATITDAAVMRTAPDSAAPVIGVLPHRVVRFRWDEPAHDGWTAVALPDGRSGWIANRDVYSPVDYRAIFAKRDGRWRMITLIAGD